MNKYKITSNESICAHEIYYKHYNSNPYFGENREPGYTFFADMVSYIFFSNDQDELLKKLQGYESRMLNTFCKKDPKAYCIMIDSLNLLAWWLYSKNNNQGDKVINWLIGEYERLFYRDYTKYVSEDQMADIWRELN